MNEAAPKDYAEALGLWLAEAPSPVVERLPPGEAAGRVLAEPVQALDALPPFDNAAMDGFALRLEGEALPEGTRLRPEGAQFAGDAEQVSSAEAIEITTGAVLPAGFDAVVPVERTTRLADGRIELTQAVRRGQHIRRCGSDIAAGSLVLPPGRVVDAEVQTIAAALGVARFGVARAPRIAVIATGPELVDDPAQPLGSGQIRNCNRPGLAARIRGAGAECVYQTTIGDDGDELEAAIAKAEAAGAQLVLSSGAVSMGRHDFVPDTLARLGARILFHRLRMRPGKPILAARLGSGLHYAGLPGNPVSTAVGFRFFVEPWIRRALGLPEERPLRLPLHAALPARGGFRFHLKARLCLDAGARLGVEILPGQESFRLAPMLEANCWAIIPADSPDLEAGSPVEVLPLCHLPAFPLSA
ncbi:molybdopterin molybdotransferase MoeA [Pseudomarimonas salicorniae]|uniref:Molybdopterin molybdenumtransferase n=1 Tax=Pseudomarimonas salicorniae TaxID=2933270 RepID=A0ABT0GF78_9GAMM|nr:gephyrin-like molybdotransferase Glp [Lysobacter sp. CAU 1642]MCK7593186.1 molybdopterin molybdotransferase MoeA [Lysobacter sp. CAU 1642]